MHDSTSITSSEDGLTVVLLPTPERVEELADRYDVGVTVADGLVHAIVRAGRYGFHYKALARTGGAA